MLCNGAGQCYLSSKISRYVLFGGDFSDLPPAGPGQLQVSDGIGGVQNPLRNFQTT